MGLRKSEVKLGPVTLAAVGTISWQLTSGVRPFVTTFSCYKDDWDILEGQIGERLNLKITDSRGESIEIRGVYILEQAPSNTPNIISFRVADKRWRWPYELVARSYNMVRKTGDKTAFGEIAQVQVNVDQYEYLPYSLDGEQQTKWTAKRAVEDVMDQLEGPGTEAGGWKEDSFPIEDGGGNPSREFSLENLEIRDPGDVALGRLLAAIPGCDVYINELGQAVIFDASDVNGGEERFVKLEEDGFTYRGQRAAEIDRKAIRPKRVFVYYQREIEAQLEYEDDFRGTTSASTPTTEPFLENMVKTVDPQTTMTIKDPNTGSPKSVDVPAGSYVPFDAWLTAMNNDIGANSAPWTFDTLRWAWTTGQLGPALGIGGKVEVDTTANVAARVAALTQHFRQTFRLNPRYMQRVKALLPYRVGLINPVTGERAPAAVWGQMCIKPTDKGKVHLATASNGDYAPVLRNVNMLAPRDSGTQLIKTAPGPHRMVMEDADLGIFRTEWIASPYGLESEAYPGFCGTGNVNAFQPKSISRNMALQDQSDTHLAMNAVVESGASGLVLSGHMEQVVLCTLVPAGPNNLLQFHREEVKASDVDAVFRRDARVLEGSGPDLHIFVPPNELTARFAWTDDGPANTSLKKIFGLVGDGLEVGEDGDIPGYTFVNKARSVSPHALSVATEALIEYADGVEGEVATRMMPSEPLKMVGNMIGAAVRVDSQGVVDTVHAFPGKQRSFSRFALLPQSARSIILRTIT